MARWHLQLTVHFQLIESLIRVRQALKEENPIEALYKESKINLTPLKIDEAEDILKYMSNTNDPKTLFQLSDIFKIDW